MRSLLILFAALGLCLARPQPRYVGLHVAPVRSAGSYVIGGIDADPGEIPWQLSLTYNGAHHCGAVLLNSNNALSAAHCVDGLTVTSIQIIAGLLNRNDLSGTQTVGLSDYQIYLTYDSGSATLANDIAILNFAQQIMIAGDIQAAQLPSDNSNDFVGTTCTISGWGSRDATNTLPNTLQKGDIPVITTAECESALAGLPDAIVWDDQICVQDPTGVYGACDADGGGPLSCPDLPYFVVAGIASWSIATASGDCIPEYPSVYTRVSSYLTWIEINSR